mmetsp:Transcript_21589/g.35762  ORF Transcript_21589/g.35762 Transcript_21589/m.35762 type:complete len:470 (+) Transcript_21589:126-1535(+)
MKRRLRLLRCPLPVVVLFSGLVLLVFIIFVGVLAKSGPERVPYLQNEFSEAMCERDLSWPLVRRWSEARTAFCIAASEADLLVDESRNSSRRPVEGLTAGDLYCHGIQQSRHVRPDYFCHGSNLYVDWLLIYPDKHSLAEAEVSFEAGAIGAFCKREGTMFSPQSPVQVGLQPILNNWETWPEAAASVISVPTIFVMRDTPYKLGRVIADMLGVYLTMHILEIEPKEVQIIAIDGHPEGPFWDAWTALAPSGVTHMSALPKTQRSETIRYERAAFAIPGSASFLIKYEHEKNDCSDSAILRSFLNSILLHYGLLHTQTSEKPVLTISSRTHRGDHIPQNRIIENEGEIFELVKEVAEREGWRAQRRDFARIPFREQIALMRNTSMLIGMHGAGMAYLNFLPPKSVVVELFPLGFHKYIYRNNAYWLGHSYLAWQNKNPANNMDDELRTRVDVGEFAAVLEQAVAILKRR